MVVKEITCKSASHQLKRGGLPYHYDLNIYRGCSHVQTRGHAQTRGQVPCLSFYIIESIVHKVNRVFPCNYKKGISDITKKAPPNYIEINPIIKDILN